MTTHHRITVQFEARLSFNLNLPHDDQSLVEAQTPIRVVVERVRGTGSSDSRNGSLNGDSLDNSLAGGMNGSIEAGAAAQVVSPCASYALILRVGEGESARDYPQAEFVHRSAAEGAGQCLLQYLASKPRLNVHGELISDRQHHPAKPEAQTYTAIGWSMRKAEPDDPDGPTTVCSRRVAVQPTEVEPEPPLVFDEDRTAEAV